MDKYFCFTNDCTSLISATIKTKVVKYINYPHNISCLVYYLKFKKIQRFINNFNLKNKIKYSRREEKAQSLNFGNFACSITIEM